MLLYELSVVFFSHKTVKALILMKVVGDVSKNVSITKLIPRYATLKKTVKPRCVVPLGLHT